MVALITEPGRLINVRRLYVRVAHSCWAISVAAAYSAERVDLKGAIWVPGKLIQASRVVVTAEARESLAVRRSRIGHEVVLES